MIARRVDGRDAAERAGVQDQEPATGTVGVGGAMGCRCGGVGVARGGFSIGGVPGRLGLIGRVRVRVGADRACGRLAGRQMAARVAASRHEQPISLAGGLSAAR